MKIDLRPLPHTSDFCVNAKVTAESKGSLLHINISGDLSDLSLRGSEQRELWRHTCFELFIRDREGKGYEEFNCAPDGRFTRTYLTSYREIHGEREFHSTPKLISKIQENHWQFEIHFPDIIIDKREIAVAVITADNQGVRRFWGVNHRDDTPDFHHDDNFFIMN